MVFIYNGDEIGMKNGDIPASYIQDPGAKGGSGRDPERTPVQWSSAKNAGFSEAERTWLPVADDYKTVNVESEGQKILDSGSCPFSKGTLQKLRN